MIYADENVWQPVADGLRRRDWDVITATEAGTLGYSDREHLEFATERGWLLLTFDDDFPELAATEFADSDHSGILYVAQHGRHVGELVRRIDAALQQIGSRTVSNEVIYP